MYYLYAYPSLVLSDFVWVRAVLLNSPQIFEKIFGDELIMDIIGSLECKFHHCCFKISDGNLSYMY
jgi:hypothetical protein